MSNLSSAGRGPVYENSSAAGIDSDAVEYP